MNEFFEHSKSIVEDFLQTAVFLDDKPTYHYDKSVEELEKKNVEVIESIPFRGSKKSFSQEETNSEEKNTKEINVEVEQEISDSIEHLLDAKTITDTFMDKGIICSILKCEEETYSSQVDNYIKLFHKSDMIVLDWDLFKDNGERIVSLLQNLIHSDTELHPFRSIIIYTANDLEVVKKKLGEINIQFDKESYNTDINNLYTLLSLYSKPNSKNATKERVVHFSELINKCIEDFTSAIHGIMPNVAMASLSEIRKNTHNLLGVLNKTLDIAYLSHRALLSNSEDAEKHAEEIIISELESIIHCNQVGQHANYDVIKNSPYIESKKYDNRDFINYLNAEPPIDKKPLNRDLKDCFTYKWYQSNEEDSKKSERDFAKLTTIQTEYSKIFKHLTLGVIIEDLEHNIRYLCLQPRCDSVRLRENTDFVFLTLEEATNNKFHLLIGEEEKKYLIKYNKDRKSIVFNVDSSLQIAVNDEEKNFIDVNEKKYKYISTLKKLKAQQIVNEYSAYISRVGLNESEYLRRSALFKD